MRKSTPSGALYTFAAAIGVGAFSAVIGAPPWAVIFLMVIIVVSGWALARSGMSGSP
jgi:hypothetical protein